MTNQSNKSSSVTRSPSLFQWMSSSRLVKVYALRILAIAVYGLLIPQEIEYADSFLLAMITVGYAGIEMLSCMYLLSIVNLHSVKYRELVFGLTLWLSAFGLVVLAFSHVVLSDALILYYKPITYALEAVLLTSLIMEIRACWEQRPEF